MPSGDEVVDYLSGKGQLGLGKGPDWPGEPLEEDEDIVEVDWSALFPKERPSRQLEEARGVIPIATELPEEWGPLARDLWDPGLDREFLGKLDEAIKGGPPKEPRESKVWDICAWYQSIHFHGYNWGIFIREQCLYSIAAQVAAFLDQAAVVGVPPAIVAKALLRAATCSLFLHEHFHHKVECLGIRLYVVEKRPFYTAYFRHIYKNLNDPYEILEEALANADSYNRLGNDPYRLWLPRCVRIAMRNWMIWNWIGSPPGYRKARQFIGGAFDQGENMLHGYLHECSLNPVQPTSEWNFAPRLTQSFFNFDHHIWSVVKGGAGILPYGTTSPVRTCSSEEIIKLLLNAGYQLAKGGKGSHVKLSKPGASMVIVPGNRKELSPGVAKNIVPALGGKTLEHLQLYLKGLIPVGHQLT